MSYLGASFFQIGGPKSTIKLARQCHIDKNSEVLDVGCGNGYNAVLISKTFSCPVVGIDISEVSIEKARERAKSEGLSGSVHFKVGDAYNLPFEEDSFDIILTSFVSQFLDMKQALKEFIRVLRPGGYVGINEMYKDSHIPRDPAAEILEAEELIAKLTELPFRLNTPTHWKRLFEESGLTEVEITESHEILGIRDSLYIIKEMGGPLKLIGIFWRMAKYFVLSKKLRARFMGLQRMKAVFLRKKSTKKHVGFVLGSGRNALGGKHYEQGP
jgi:ubiquinone/menaquinone biosynthesis C-methylase UbiE